MLTIAWDDIMSSHKRKRGLQGPLAPPLHAPVGFGARIAAQRRVDRDADEIAGHEVGDHLGLDALLVLFLHAAGEVDAAASVADEASMLNLAGLGHLGCSGKAPGWCSLLVFGP